MGVYLGAEVSYTAPMIGIQPLRDWAARHVPSSVYHSIAGFYYRCRSRKTGRPDRPPRHLAFVYGFDPDFDRVGDEFLDYFRRLCGLLPRHHVLDIGCGIGRCALPLTTYLSDAGGYCGFDIREDGIAWCKEHMEARFPHFRFQHVDLANATYRPGGKTEPDHFRFPYSDDSFDLVFSKSVFTHLRAPVVRSYVQETRRVLKPGGKSLHTFFLLTDESREGQANGRAQFDFRYPVRDGATVSRSEPEKAIAFEESAVRAWYRDAGLTIEEPIRYGQWSGRPDGLSGQDIIIAVKP